MTDASKSSGSAARTRDTASGPPAEATSAMTASPVLASGGRTGQRSSAGARPCRASPREAAFEETGESMSNLTATQINSLAGDMLQEVLRRTHLSAAPDVAIVVAEEG